MSLTEQHILPAPDDVESQTITLSADPLSFTHDGQATYYACSVCMAKSKQGMVLAREGTEIGRSACA